MTRWRARMRVLEVADTSAHIHDALARTDARSKNILRSAASRYVTDDASSRTTLRYGRRYALSGMGCFNSRVHSEEVDLPCNAPKAEPSATLSGQSMQDTVYRLCSDATSD